MIDLERLFQIFLCLVEYRGQFLRELCVRFFRIVLNVFQRFKIVASASIEVGLIIIRHKFYSPDIIWTCLHIAGLRLHYLPFYGVIIGVERVHQYSLVKHHLCLIHFSMINAVVDHDAHISHILLSVKLISLFRHFHHRGCVAKLVEHINIVVECAFLHHAQRACLGEQVVRFSKFFKLDRRHGLEITHFSDYSVGVNFVLHNLLRSGHQVVINSPKLVGISHVFRLIQIGSSSTVVNHISHHFVPNLF